MSLDSSDHIVWELVVHEQREKSKAKDGSNEQILRRMQVSVPLVDILAKKLL